jgi:Rrf2 family protein
MLALAVNDGKGQQLLRDIARSEEISEKYLSIIIIPLRRRGLVKSVRGARGGYTLARRPDEVTVRDIVDVLEESSLVDCVRDSSVCGRAGTCASRDIWDLLSRKISETLASITLADLVRMRQDKTEPEPAEAETAGKRRGAKNR